jgi:hypothetical protein
MWLGIIALLDKLFGIIGQLTGFWIQRSDASQKKRDAAQVKMDEAVTTGDWDAWKKARNKRNKA